MTKIRAIERAVAAAGGQAELARRLTVIMSKPKPVTQQQVWNWLFRDSEVPAEYIIPIEKAIESAVTRHELRPDIYPLDLA
jgi:DNA-binding transcriptional regulator YdaS (Cro superfamily)